MKRIIKKAFDYSYETVSYAIGASTGAGFGNALGNIRKGLNFSEGFGEGFVNNFPYGLTIAALYPITINRLLKTNHPRINSNLFQLAVSAGVLTWHYLVGTENPIETLIPIAAVMFPMVNQRVSNSKNLENKLVN